MLELSAALAAARASMDLAKVALAARDDAKVKAAISDMAEKLSDANFGALAMSERLRALDAQLGDVSAKLRAAEERERERKRYVLRELRPGTFVYAYQPVAEDQTPPHNLCQPCFDSGKRVVLRLQVSGLLGESMVCANDRRHEFPI